MPLHKCDICLETINDQTAHCFRLPCQCRNAHIYHVECLWLLDAHNIDNVLEGEDGFIPDRRGVHQKRPRCPNCRAYFSRTRAAGFPDNPNPEPAPATQQEEQNAQAFEQARAEAYDNDVRLEAGDPVLPINTPAQTADVATQRETLRMATLGRPRRYGEPDEGSLRARLTREAKARALDPGVGTIIEGSTKETIAPIPGNRISTSKAARRPQRAMFLALVFRETSIDELPEKRTTYFVHFTKRDTTTDICDAWYQIDPIEPGRKAVTVNEELPNQPMIRAITHHN
ncbi:unnamed protein product [Zymoseptoria tritici ST99CH_3D1]|nr:unnamed protein product [Zymoseptoria tritici ST99CH_3D1]